MFENYPIRFPIQENIGIDPKNVFISISSKVMRFIVSNSVKFSKSDHHFRQIQLNYRENNFENTSLDSRYTKTLW